MLFSPLIQIMGFVPCTSPYPIFLCRYHPRDPRIFSIQRGIAYRHANADRFEMHRLHSNRKIAGSDIPLRSSIVEDMD